MNNELEVSLIEFQNRILEKISNPDYSSILEIIREIVKSSIDQNFMEGGRFGNELFGGGTNRWKPSKRAIKQKGQTLLDKGQLASSIQVVPQQQGNELVINAGSNLPYAAIHNLGGVINFPSRSRLYVQNRYQKSPKKGQFKKGTVFGRGLTTKASKVEIPPRPYLVLQDEDITRILEIIVENIFR